MFRQIQGKTRAVFQTLAFLIVALSLLVGFFPTSAYAKSRLEQSAAGCAPIHFIGIMGSGENDDKKEAKEFGMGGVVSQTYTRFSKKMQDRGTNVSAEGLQYDAVSVAEMLKWRGNLTRSVEVGTTLLTRSLLKQKLSCPYQMVVLVGYSQGAMVIHQALDNLSPDLKRNIRAVLVFGDPLFDQKNKQSVMLGNYIRLIHTPAGGFKGKKDFPDWVYGIRSYCKVYDPVCDADVRGLAACTVKPLCQHFYYYGDKSLHEQAASYLASLFPSQSMPDSPMLTTDCGHLVVPWVALYQGLNYSGRELCFEGRGTVYLTDYGFDSQARSVNIAANVVFYDHNRQTISFGYGSQTGNLFTWKDRIMAMTINS